MKVELIATRDNIAELRIDGRTVFVPYIVQGTQVSFKYDGETYSIDNGDIEDGKTIIGYYRWKALK